MNTVDNIGLYPSPEKALRSNLRPRKAPRLAARLEQLALSGKLPKVIGQRVQALADLRSDRRDFDKALPTLDFLYQCWVRSPELGNIGKSLDTYDSFLGIYIPDITPNGRAGLMTQIGGFRDRIVHPSRHIQIYPKNTGGAGDWNRDIYSARGDWVYLPYEGYKYDFIEKEALDEILRNADVKRGNFAYHSTSSAALQGISEVKAIISSREAISRGQKITSGEHAFYQTSHDRQYEPKRGLSNVFAKSGIVRSYGMPGWFSDYPVTFRIDLGRLNYFRQERGLEPISYYDDVAGEGLPIGKEVPLQFVDAMFSFHVDLPRTKDWAVENCPAANVFSYENYELLSAMRYSRKGYDFLTNTEFVRRDQAIKI